MEAVIDAVVVVGAGIALTPGIVVKIVAHSSSKPSTFLAAMLRDSIIYLLCRRGRSLCVSP